MPNGIDFGLASAGFFELLVTFNNVAGPVDLAVYDKTDPTGARRAIGTINLPAGIDIDVSTDPAQAFLLSFAAMTLQGGAMDALFRTVGAITMTINAAATGQGRRDVNLDLLRAFIQVPAPIPAPAVAVLLLLGLAALWTRRRTAAR